MVRQHLRRLLALLLLGVTLGWPLLGSAPSVSGGRARALAAGEADGCPDCGGCAGDRGHGQACPTTLCSVIPAVVPLPALGRIPPAVRPGRPDLAQERGRGRVPEVQLPPPRPSPHA